jgi:serine/threonine protein kinase
MLTDRKASEMISRSLAGNLSRDETDRVSTYLNENTDAAAFVELTRAIQDSAAKLAEVDLPTSSSVPPSLSEEAKARMKRSVGDASARLSLNTAMTIDTPAISEDAPLDHAANETQSRETRARFRLIRKIGEGGLGTVWLARDLWLKRVVAVKEMRLSALESPRARSRFLREAQITGHLEHPSIVPLYLFGEDPATGRPFYAMRFAGKQTLADAIVEFHERRDVGVIDELGLHRLLQSFLRICQAIGYVHSRGVIHRDLKPENVAIDNFGQVVVLDWGLAKVLDDGELGTKLSLEQNTEESDGLLSQTLDGEVVGTPLYMAPEQAAGDLDKVDQQTDVYGLGAILFAILTGCAPHEQSNTSLDGHVRVRDLLESIAASESPSPRDTNPDIPADLAAICAKAMAKRRHGRHRSANELAEEVERWLAGQRERQTHYDQLRMEGRELRATADGMIRDVGRNVRFMANLPPIQGIIEAQRGESSETESVWRERLTTIFMGLLRANADYAAISYCQVEGDQSKEIVRVVRHSTDLGNLRAVPSSRLVSSAVDAWSQAVIDQHPEEAFANVTGGPAEVRALAAGVPVFDDVSEELFGYVRIECALERTLENLVRTQTSSASYAIIVDHQDKIWMHFCSEKGRLTSDCGAAANSSVSNFAAIQNALANSSEYLDEADYELYGTRIDLAAGVSWLTLILGNNHRRS